MSKHTYKEPKWLGCFGLPVNLSKYRSKIDERKWDWLAENICGRETFDNMMFPAAVPWCELKGKTYEESWSDTYAS